VRNSTVVQ